MTQKQAREVLFWGLFGLLAVTAGILVSTGDTWTALGFGIAAIFPVWGLFLMGVCWLIWQPIRAIFIATGIKPEHWGDWDL